MEKSYTPGPWHANTPAREEDCTDVTIREPRHGDLIATVTQGKINAELIAAAPDLVRALEIISNYTKCQCSETHGDNENCPVLIAEQAHAKITGG